MKCVSFSVAKALKEAGYKFTPIQSSFFVNDTNAWYSEEDAELYSLPYAMEVWLWLWREKNIQIDIDYARYNTAAITSMLVKGEEFPDVFEKKDPEEAIEKAIEYLVEQNLLK